MIYEKLLNKYPLISDQVDRRELAVILLELEKMLMADGTLAGEQGASNRPDFNVVEFGCYVGTTSLFIARLLTHYQSSGNFHVYDSFSGLPSKDPQDASPAGEQFKEGELAVSKREFIGHFKKAGLKLPHIHKAWFNEVTRADVPEDIGLAFLDGDYYRSVRDPLNLITPKLRPGAVVIIDDYANLALPGASRAVDEWLARHPQNKLRVIHSLAVISHKSSL